MFMADFFERYFDRYIEEPMSGCWPWLGSLTTAGYGNLTVNYETLYAHRCSFECVNGDGSADGVIVRHRCDFPCCINPEHLIGGTQMQNVADMISRGRANRAFGVAVNTAKLTGADVVVMRDMARSGQTIAEIKKLFPVKWDTINNAVTGKNWPHIPGALAASDLKKGGRHANY
jgi:hypothetical protein